MSSSCLPRERDLSAWWYPAGNGSQWAGMGRELLGTSPAFCQSVRECARVLEPYGLDLLSAYESKDGWEDPCMAAVGLTSLQVGGWYQMSFLSAASMHAPCFRHHT